MEFKAIAGSNLKAGDLVYLRGRRVYRETQKSVKKGKKPFGFVRKDTLRGETVTICSGLYISEEIKCRQK